MSNNVTEKLAKYGLAGVAIALIILNGITIKFLYELSNHNTSILIDVVERNTRTEERLIGVVENLEEFLKNK